MVQYGDDVDDEKKIDYCVNQNKRTGLRIINISARKYQMCKFVTRITFHVDWLREYCYRFLLKSTFTYNRKFETKDS